MTKTILTIAACATLLWAGAALATPTPGQICAAAKQTAAGQLGIRKLACYAKYTKNVSFDLASCLTRAENKFSTAFQRAELAIRGNPRGCAITGDAAAIKALVDNFVAEVVGALPSIPPPTPTQTPTETPTQTPTQTSTETPPPTPLPMIDNGDGTITDPNTGLMWEKKSDDGSIHDWDDTYTWSTGSPWNPDGTAFTVFLASLNTPPCFAGHCDWRLPSEEGHNPPYTGAKELESILAPPFPCATHPCVPAVFNTGCTPGCTVAGCSCTQSHFYWSASASAGSPFLAWDVFFNFALVLDDVKTTPDYVRAVRSGL